MNITAYCGVALGNNPAFEQSAIELGTWIGEQGHTLVYGGGGVGMMGALADAVLEHGGKVIGIIPQFLVDREQLNDHLHNPVVVETMAERKTLLYNHADAFIMLPGGIGTFEEITEVLSQTKLGFITAPIFIANINNCYGNFIQSLYDLIENGFLEEEEAPFTVANTIEELTQYLKDIKHIERTQGL